MARVDTKTGSTASGTSMSTAALTVSGSNAFVVAHLHFETSTPTGVSVSRDGQSFTEITTDGLKRHTRLFKLTGPNSGSAAVSASWTGTDEAVMIAVSYDTIDQTTPNDALEQNSNTSNTPTLTAVNGASGDTAICFFAVNNDGSLTSTGVGTQIAQVAVSTDLVSSFVEASGASSNAFAAGDAAFEDWHADALSLNPAAGGGGGVSWLGQSDVVSSQRTRYVVW